MDSKLIGQKLRALRSKMGLTTVTLAKKVRLSQAQVSRLENGLQGFRSATLITFAKALGVAPASLLTSGKEYGQVKVADEIDALGLTPSRRLVSALKNPGFLKFAERCARAMKAHKKNLGRMERALRGLAR